MIIKIASKRWRFIRAYIKGGGWGKCDPPDTVNKAITIKASLVGENELDTIVHEILHAAAWQLLSEEWVDETATDIARALYRLGYRKVQ